MSATGIATCTGSCIRCACARAELADLIRRVERIFNRDGCVPQSSKDSLVKARAKVRDCHVYD